MSTEKIYLMVKWRVKSGQLEEVKNLLDEIGTKSSQEPGNLAYEVHQSTEDQNVLCLYEAYENEAAVEVHKASAHYQKIVLETIIPMLEEREVIKLKPLFVQQ